MPYRTPPQIEERKAKMRARLVATARRLFAAQGFEATTLQHIVHTAGTSIGNCYFYFPNKETLLLAVADQVCEEIGANLDRRIAQAPAGPAQPAVAMYAGVL